VPIQKKLFIRRCPTSVTLDADGGSHPTEELQAWEDKLNSPALADFHVAQFEEVEGFLWVVLEREV